LIEGPGSCQSFFSRHGSIALMVLVTLLVAGSMTLIEPS